MAVARNVIRRAFTAPVRITLLENDVDELEQTLAGAIGDFKAALKEEGDKLRGTMKWVIGSFFSVVLAIIGALAVLAFK